MLLLASVPTLFAANDALTKDEELNLLKIRQAQLRLDRAHSEMEHAKIEFDEIQKLYDERIYTVEDLNKARQAHEEAVLDYRQAEIDLQKTRLEFLTDATLISVIAANKFRVGDGKFMATITLRNESDTSKARIAMREGKDISGNALDDLLTVENIIVTLIGRGVIVSDPYQLIIPSLRNGQSTNLTYELLNKDLEAVEIELTYLNITKRKSVILKKDAREDLPSIASTQYAQQGQLGTRIRYDLELERLAETERSFPLVVVNLPPEIPFAFLDPESSARITQLKFTRELSKQSLDFEVSIPEKLDQSFIDRSIEFSIFVTRRSELQTIADLRKQYEGGTVPPEDLNSIKGARADLILVPKGVGKVEIVVANLFKEIRQSENAEIRFTLLNSGTLALRRVTPEIDAPLDWVVEVEPKEAATILPGQKQLFTLTSTPHETVGVGEYTIKINAEGHSGVQTVEALSKTFTVRIAAKGNLTGTVFLAVILIGLVVGLAALSVRISRR